MASRSGEAPPPRHLAGSILSVGASRALTLVAVALTSVVITAILGPAGIGTYSVAYAILFVVTVIAEIGLPQGAAYFVARDEWSGPALVRGALGACLLLGAAGAALILGAFALAADAIPELDWTVTIAIAAALPASLLWRVGPQIALARERFELFAVFDSAPNLLACPLAIGAAAIWGTDAAVIAMAASVIASGALIATWLLAAEAPRQTTAAPGGMRGVLAFGLRPWVSELLVQVNLRGDLILVGAYLGAAAAGIYSVALSATSVAWVLIEAFAISALPRSARLHAAGDLDSTAIALRDASAGRVMRHAVLAIPPVALGAAALLAIGVPLFYGSEFGRSIDLGFILLAGSLAFGVGRAALAILLAHGRADRVLQVGMVIVPATVVAYLIAIPAAGLDAAAIVSSCSYLAFTALAVVALSRASRIALSALLVPRRTDVADYRHSLDQAIAYGRRAFGRGRG